MKSFKVILGASLIVAAAAGTLPAMEHEASADRGKALFNDAKLGTTGKSCNDCHPSGKGLEKAGSKPGLDQTINQCITQAIKGKALDVHSVEMQSMEMYIKSLGAMEK